MRASSVLSRTVEKQNIYHKGEHAMHRDQC